MCIRDSLIADANAYFKCAIEEPGTYLYAALTAVSYTHLDVYKRQGVGYNILEGSITSVLNKHSKILEDTSARSWQIHRQG